MDTVQLKNKAVNLRKSGLSYGEIIKEIKVPKSTLSYWLKGISLDDRQSASLKSRLIEKQKRGRFSTSIALRARKVFKEKVAFDSAEKEFRQLTRETFFMTGIALYWAHGGKKGNHFQFVTSDPSMLSLMIIWTGKYLNIPKNALAFRIFIKEAYSAQNLDNFWSKTLLIPKERLKITVLKGPMQKHDPYYKGSCTVTITGVAVLRKVLAWQNLLIKYYKDKRSH